MNIRNSLNRSILVTLLTAAGIMSANAGELNQYVIERNIPGAGELSAEELREISAKSNSVLSELGDEIRWVQSYVSEGTVYCVYEARDAEIIRLHAQKGGFPADRVSRVSNVIDPSTGR
jgi:hypothetical protein